MHNTSNRNYPNYLPFAHSAVFVCVPVSLCAICKPTQCGDLSISAPKKTSRGVICVVKSSACRLFHLLVIHNNFLDVEITGFALTAICKKTTGNKH